MSNKAKIVRFEIDMDLSAWAITTAMRLATDNDLGEMQAIFISSTYEEFEKYFPEITFYRADWLKDWAWFAQFERGIIPSGVYQ